MPRGLTQWDEGLRTVRQFNDLLRVLPPLPQEAPQEEPAPRSAAPSRPLAPAGRAELPTGVRSRPQADAGLLADASHRETSRREPRNFQR